MINIQDIIPFMKDGWVAMDCNRVWWWFDCKPVIDKDLLQWANFSDKCGKINGFDIVPANDWTKSLIEIDNTARKKFEEEYQNNIQKTIQELKQDE